MCCRGLGKIVCGAICRGNLGRLANRRSLPMPRQNSQSEKNRKKMRQKAYGNLHNTTLQGLFIKFRGFEYVLDQFSRVNF